jgi:chromosome segregation ATPase
MNKNFSMSEIIEASNNILNESSNNLTITKNNHPEPLLLVNEISEDLNIEKKIKNEIIKELYLFFKKKIRKNTLKIIFEQRIEIKKFERKINYLNDNKKILETNNHNLQSNIDKIIEDKKILETNNHNLQFNIDKIIEDKKILETNNHNLQFNIDKIIEDKKILETNNHNLQSNIDKTIEDKKILTERNKNIQADLSLLKSNLKNNLENEKNLNNEKLATSNDKLKFYQEDNLRLSNELFVSKERYNIIKKQLHDFELQKKQLSNQIQKLNNSINESNLITPTFTDNLPAEATEDLKKTKDKDVANLNEKINKLFDKL